MPAYNNYFPMSYQPMQYYPQQQNNYPQQQTVQQPQSGIIWVQGENAAKSYLVAPNTTVALWDSENSVIYLKSADASGMPTIKVLDYKIRDAVQPMQQIPVVNNQVDYVTHEEFKAFEEQVQEQIASITSVKSTRSKKEEKANE